MKLKEMGAKYERATGTQRIDQTVVEKGDDALCSARLELKEGHVNFSVNRLYYGCFYAVTALLLKDGKQYSRHSGVKSEFARCYIKTGKIDTGWNKFYQKLFDGRQEGDYIPTVTFETSEISSRLKKAEEFIDIIRNLLEVGG